MNNKQKKMLYRIILSAVLIVIIKLLPLENRYVELLLFLVPYRVRYSQESSAWHFSRAGL